MQASREMVKLMFAVLIVSAFLVATLYLLNPFLRQNFIVFDDTIATYVDTLSAVDSGTVKITVERGSISKIDVAYKRKSYQRTSAAENALDSVVPSQIEESIPEDGWYVLATYSIIAGRETVSATKINSYPKDANLRASLFSPTKVCITKDLGSRYARVDKC